MPRTPKRRIQHVHILALRTKGLTREAYKLRLQAVGVESCKQLKQPQYRKFLAGRRKLPDAPKRYTNKHPKGGQHVQTVS